MYVGRCIVNFSVATLISSSGGLLIRQRSQPNR